MSLRRKRENRTGTNDSAKEAKYGQALELSLNSSKGPKAKQG